MPRTACSRVRRLQAVPEDRESGCLGRSHGRFGRRLKVPPDIQVEKCSDVCDGALRIAIPATKQRAVAGAPRSAAAVVSSELSMPRTSASRP